MIVRLLLGFLLVGALAGAAVATDPGAGDIADVQISARSFNPARGQSVRLAYRLTRPDQVTVRVWDPDGALVRTLVDRAPRDAGSHAEAWDGVDGQGRRVPDEAYTFTIETAGGSVFDPTTFSGGVVADIRDAGFDSSAGTVVYTLPSAARVLIRLGIHSGPMLKTLVDWKPRVAGAVTEYWDGRDENKLIRVRDHARFTTLITYVTLPDATVIAYGNERETYRDYKLGRGKGATLRPARPRRPEAGRLRPENLVPPAWARAPRVRLTFPQANEGIPRVQEAIEVRVDVDPTDRDLLLRDEFEIIFFVDNVFFAEAERGHLPFTWRWEVKQLPPGEHVLTVNIASFKGQVGAASRKIEVTERR